MSVVWWRVWILCAPFICADIFAYFYVFGIDVQKIESTETIEITHLMQENKKLKEQVNDLYWQVRGANFYHEGPFPTIVNEPYPEATY